MTWIPQNVFKARNLVISDKQQNAPGVAIGDAELLRRLRFDPSSYIAITDDFRSDRDKTGKGHSFPTYRVQTDQNTALDLTFDIDDYLAGWIAAFTMGNRVTTGAGPYTHTFTYQSSSFKAALITLYSEDTAGLKRKFLDFGISQAEFSGTGRGPVQCRLSMVGGGKITDGAITSLPALPTITEILGSDLQFLIGPPGAPVAIDQDRVVNWTVTIIQDLEAKRRPGSTLYASEIAIGQPLAKLAMTISAKETDDLFTLVKNNTVQEIQLNMNSGAAAQLKFQFPSIYLSAAQVGTDGREVVMQIESNEDSILKTGAGEPLVVTVINSQATYLTLAA